jgi:Stage II sporulation protein E (SpoIIE)
MRGSIAIADTLHRRRECSLAVMEPTSRSDRRLLGDRCLFGDAGNSIAHGRLVDHKPVQADTFDRLPELIEVNRFLDVAVRPQSIALHQVPLFLRGRRDLEVNQILSQVNRMLMDDLGDGCFVTLMLVSLDVGARSLVYAGAGHIPGYVLNPAGSTEHTLESSGPPLGLFPNVRFSRNPSIVLHPGQTLVLLTDGITESASPDGREWGAQGALHYVATHIRQPASQLVAGLYREALRFACNEAQKDDITSVIVKVQGTSGVST